MASSVQHTTVSSLTLSYNIACQWEKNRPARWIQLPDALKHSLDNVELQCGLPVWHGSSHQEDCEKENSLSYLPGVGKTDGEGVE